MAMAWVVALLMSQAGSDAPAAAGLEALRKCQAIAADAERLRCFDAAAAALVTSVDRKDVIVTDRQEVDRTKRSLFGFSLPRIGLFSEQPGDAEKEGITTLTVPLKSVAVVRGGYVRFVVEDNAVWQTTEAVQFPPKTGTQVTLRKAALGSYLVRFANGKTFRAKRVE